jgi:hypothetical protein
MVFFLSYLISLDFNFSFLFFFLENFPFRKIVPIIFIEYPITRRSTLTCTLKSINVVVRINKVMGTVPRWDFCHDVQPLFPHSALPFFQNCPHPHSPGQQLKRVFSKKFRRMSQREKMEQCLGTNARHSFKNALTLKPRTAVKESIGVRAFLKPCIKQSLSF